MSDEDLKDELKPFYEKGDCCSWIVELRKDKYQLQQENKHLKSILTELEEYIKKHIEEWENNEDEYLNGVVAEDKDILQLIQELRNMYEKNE